MPKTIFKLPACKQARSRATTARFVEVAAKLLETDVWDNISIERLVGESGLSTGAFYKRFRCKDDVLAAYVENALEEGRAQAARLLKIDGGLRLRVEMLVELLAEGWKLRGGAVRAAKAIKEPAHLHSLQQQSVDTQATITAWLLERQDEFAHPSPARAISSAFALPLAALQAALANRQLSLEQHDELVQETASMISAYFMGSST